MFNASHREAKPFRVTVALAIACTISALLVCMSAAPTPAGATTYGVGDNGPALFSDPNYQALKTRISRKILPYDFYQYKAGRDDLSAWLAGAKSRRVQPLIAFNHSERNRRKLPSVGQFKKALRYLRRHHPQVRTFSPWNEANHVSQPTYRHPKRAAQYYNAARRICKRCKIVAADVLDQRNMIPWVKKFKRYAKKPKIWGLHSYADTNRRTSWRKSSTRKLLRNVRGKVWLTETGGLVAFKTRFRYSERRAATAIGRTFRLARKSRRIQRVYFYSWFGTFHAEKKTPYKWDSGFVSHDAKPRPALRTLQTWLKRSRR